MNWLIVSGIIPNRNPPRGGRMVRPAFNNVRSPAFWRWKNSLPRADTRNTLRTEIFWRRRYHHGWSAAPHVNAEAQKVMSQRVRIPNTHHPQIDEELDNWLNWRPHKEVIQQLSTVRSVKRPQRAWDRNLFNRLSDWVKNFGIEDKPYMRVIQFLRGLIMSMDLAGKSITLTNITPTTILHPFSQKRGETISAGVQSQRVRWVQNTLARLRDCSRSTMFITIRNSVSQRCADSG
jgi:hypothetical protein